MRPAEIKRLLHQSPALQEALKADKNKIYAFLRKDVYVFCLYDDAHLKPVQTDIGIIHTVTPHMRCCPRCRVDRPHDTFAMSPYNVSRKDLESPFLGALYRDMWCFECVLQAFLGGEPSYDDAQLWRPQTEGVEWA